MKDHYDICVAGFWYGYNYGSLLNGYAEYCLIKSFNKEVLMLQKPQRTPNDPEITRGHNTKFVQAHYDMEDISPSLPYDRLEELNERCDCFCAGSDQIWNYTLSFHENMFLPFVHEDKKLISFATSFGHKEDQTPSKAKDRVKAYLKRFHAISVREAFDVDILENEYGLKSSLVFEPVFCFEKNFYEELAAESTFEEPEPYILAYILDPTPEKRVAITYYAQASGMKAVIILDGVETSWERKKQAMDLPNILSNVGVVDFLKVFMNASYVITDSFHGSAFSIIFNKPFLCVGNYGRGYERFVDLFERLKIRGRLVSDPANIPLEAKYLQPINYIETPIKDMPDIELPQCAVTSVLDQSNCTGCGLCVNVCSAGALLMRENQDGFLNPSMDYMKCTDCGICEKKCIMLHPQYDNTESPECYAVWADNEIRKVSSSGGVFTLAADYIFDHGGYVCGAAFKDDFTVEHIIISGREELHLLQGSKYIQSDASGIYKKVKALLDGGNLVLFTGLPCQVAGIKAFLGKDYEDFYTIDLVCHGIASVKVFKKYMQDVHQGKDLLELQFRAKEPWGWHGGVKAKFADGSYYEEPAERDPYYMAYLNNVSLNRACGVCVCNKLPRQADLTIGDFWGISKFDKNLNDNQGTSVLLENNPHGKKLMEYIQRFALMCKSVPLHFALDGNTIMKKPYPVSKNRDYFFNHLDETDFSELTVACITNDFRTADQRILEGLSPSMHGFYILAKIVSQHYSGRKIVTWGKNPIFTGVLKKYFNLEPAFNVTVQQQYVDETTKFFDVLKGKSNEYFVINLGKAYAAEDENRFKEYGYTEIKDYVYRMPKPIVLDHYDLKGGNYIDFYGNSITGFSGIVKKVVFRGFNNHIEIGKNVTHMENLNFDLSTNNMVIIGENCRFYNTTKFEMFNQGAVSATVRIERNCSFRDSLFRLFGHRHMSSVLINSFSTFEENLCMHANQGKKIIIGRNCMFSRNINLWSGDGHTIFDVRTGENTNSDYDKLPIEKKQIVLGNHVWVGENVFVMHGTNVGSGSIIGAQSVVKGKFLNNCVVAGNPAKMVKTDVAWSSDMETVDIRRCGSPEYAVQTSTAEPSVSGLNVLVIGGTRFMGIKLVQELLENGNNVTIATRGIAKDTFGNRVHRIRIDISKADSVKRALDGKYYDVVFDDLAYCSNYVRNVLSVIKCGKYIQLSSIAVYYPTIGHISEENFDPYHSELEWIGKENVNYIEGKRQAESAAYQFFPNIETVTVRVPYVTRTEGLYYFCKNILNSVSMNIKDGNRGIAFIRDIEVGRFLPWIAAQNFSGPINISSNGIVTINEIIHYIENKTKKQAIIDTKEGIKAPFDASKTGESFSLDISIAEKLGYVPSELQKWFWNLMDEYIARALKEKQ